MMTYAPRRPNTNDVDFMPNAQRVEKKLHRRYYNNLVSIWICLTRNTYQIADPRRNEMGNGCSTLNTDTGRNIEIGNPPLLSITPAG